MPLGATVAFSSIAARFGNRGQADYSAANDLLCKIASNFRTTRPATRAIAIDWTAWAGIGMAARGSIPKMMEAAGIDMLPPEAGIPLIRRELTMGGTRGEVVIGQRLGILMNELDSTGGLLTAGIVVNPQMGATASDISEPGSDKLSLWTHDRQGHRHGAEPRPHHRDDARSQDSAVPVRSSNRRHASAAWRDGD